MSKYLLLLQSNALSGREDDYAKWYDEIHIPEVLTQAGFRSAQRFNVSGELAGVCAHHFFVIYEIEIDGNPDSWLKSLKESQMELTDAFDVDSPFGVLLQPVSDPILAN